MKLFSPSNRGINVDDIINSIYLSIDMINNKETFNWDIIPKLEINE